MALSAGSESLIDDWQSAEREMSTAHPGCPEAALLRDEVARLRRGYVIPGIRPVGEGEGSFPLPVVRRGLLPPASMAAR